jgi:hypothetical protein
MEHEMQHQHSNNYACNNTGIVGSSVLCASMPKMTSCNHKKGSLSATEHWNIKINEYEHSGLLLFSQT